ncbi:MAG TPA: DUF2520 domain-containing protein [Flavisolibacter sp.]|nr:DUF2520 domain-containing protein [Flavisolibacter sp.]
MEIVIIGTGNTASVLGRKLKAAGHRIVQVYGRDSAAASELAYDLNTESTNYWNVVNREADIYVLAVSDIAIEEVIKELQLPDKTIVHTAAAVSKNIFEKQALHYGVFYPLQSLKKGIIMDREIPILIDASDETTLQELEKLAHTISDTVYEADDEQRLKLHMAAVFCNNFVNHIYFLMQQYCRREGLDFTLLQPLIRETAERIEFMSPAESQTGPALRKDRPTIQKHLELLTDYPQLKEIYQLMSESIIQMQS